MNFYLLSGQIKRFERHFHEVINSKICYKIDQISSKDENKIKKPIINNNPLTNMLKNKTDIEKWLNKYKIMNYTVQDYMTVDVAGEVNLELKKLTSIDVQFGTVDGDFLCDGNKLTSLRGCPHTVKGSFRCYKNNLTSLIGGPQTVQKSYHCVANQLTSLKGCPSHVEGGFNCSDNLLTSLKDGPQEVGGDFFCDNNQLTSLKGIPKVLHRDFLCIQNRLKCLKDGPEQVHGQIYASFNPITTLKNFKTVYHKYLYINSKIEDSEEYAGYYESLSTKEVPMLIIGYDDLRAIQDKESLETILPEKNIGKNKIKI